MSSLSLICEYSSNSEDSNDSESDKIDRRQKLPIPDLSRIPVVASELHVDIPQLHGGRKRAFPHVRGNWATFVYVNYPIKDVLEKLVQKLKSAVSSQDQVWQRCEDLHISLSKTLVLNYHWIAPFNTSLQRILSNTESFDLGFGAVKVLCNEDSSRTFIVLEVDHFSKKYLLSISKKVDQVLTEFNLPTFYDDPSFHMSILWTNGNKKSEINGILENLNEILAHEIGTCFKTTSVDKVNCKSGNKYFQYYLQ